MADRYWVGGTGTWTTTTTNWSATSGGASGASAPTATDSVFFDQAATYTVTMTGALACLDITVSAGTVTFATGTTPSLTVSGSMTLIAGTIWNSNGGITFNSLSSRTITTNGVIINGAITFNRVGGGWSLGSALTLGATLTTTLTTGTLTLNGFDLTTGIFSSSGTSTRSIAFGTNNIILATTTAAQINLAMAVTTGFTFTGTGGFTAAANLTRTFQFASTTPGGDEPNLSFTGSGTAVQTLTTASYFKTLDFGTTAFVLPTTSVNLNSLVLSSGGTFTGLSVNMFRTGTVTGNSKTISTFGITSSNVSVNDTINCGVLSISSGGIFNFTSGTINPTSVDIGGNGRFTYGGTAVLGAVSSFATAVSSTAIVTFDKAYSLTSTGTYTHGGGTLNLNSDLTTGIFNSNNGAVRTINFSTYNIILATPTAAQVVLSMGTLTNFAWTGTGGFVSNAAVTRTYTVGTTAGGSTTGATNLSIISGTAVPTFTNNSWFKVLDFTGSSVTNTSATSVQVSSAILSSGGTFTNLSISMIGIGSLTSNGKTINLFGTSDNATATLADALSCASATLSSGTLNSSGYNITCSGTITIINVTLTSTGTITCATWQVSAVTFTFNFTNGTINPSVSFVMTSGTFNYNGGTLGPVPTFTHTAGTVTLSNSYALTSVGTYTFNGGQLNLGNYTLTTAIFNAGSAGTARSIDFGTSSLLEITGNNATVLSLNQLSGYTGTVQIICTYVGSVGTRTITIGAWSQSTVGTAAFDFKCNACVGIQVYGGATDIVSPGGNVLNFDLTGMNFTLNQIAMTIYGNYTIPASGGSVPANANTTTFASTNATARTITISRSIDFPITFNGVGGTFQLGANLTVTGATRIMSLLSGTLSLNGYDLTVGYFSSNNSNTRAINFGASNSITITGTGTPWDTTITTGLTVTGSRTVNIATPGTSTISLVNGATEANAFDFNFSGTTTVNFLQNAGLAARNVNFTGFSGTLNATNVVTIYGSYTLSATMTVVASSNIMTFGATGSTNTITTNGKTMPPMVINGIGGTFNLGSNLTSSGAIQVLAGTFDTTASNYAITCTSLDSSVVTSTRAISLNASTVTVSGTAGVTLNEVNLTFTSGTSQLTLNNTTSTVLSVIGSEAFYDVSLTGGAPLVTIVGTNTYNNLTFANGSTVPSVVTITGNQTVTGTLSNTSTNALTRLQIQSSVSGTQIILSAAIESLNDVDFKDIDAAGAAIPFVGTRLGNLGNNTDITFDAGVNKYWNLAAGGNWSAVAWATTSGGTPDVNNFPLAQDTCVIQNTGLNTSATITMNGNWVFGTLDMSTRTNAMTLAIGTTSPTVTGNWTNGTGTTLTGTGTVNFRNTGTTQTITASGITFTPNLNYDSNGGTIQLATALTLGATTTFTLTKGTLSLNGFTLTTGIFSSNNSFTRSIAFGTTNIILAHTTAGTNVLDMASLSNFSTSGTGQFTSAMGVTRTFNSGTLSAVTGSLAFNGTSQYAYIPYGQGGTNWVGTLDVSSDSVPLTLEAWINLSSTPSGYGTIASLWETFANTSKAFAFSVNSSLELTIQTGNAGGVATLSGGAIPLNTWTHVAWVKGSSLQYLYVNGQLVASNTRNPNVASVARDYVIGARYQSGYTSFFSGNISNVRFVNGVEVYTGNFTPSISPLTPTQSSGTNISAITAGQTELLLNTPNNASILADGSINNFILTNAGATTSASTPITSLPAPGTPPSLSLTSGAAIPTLATGSYFTNLNFTGTTSVPAASLITVNGDLTLATGGTYTGLGVTMAGTGTITPLGKTIAAFAVNTPGTVTLAAALACTSFAMQAGTLNFATFNLTCSAAASYTSGTLSNLSTITCTTWTTQGIFAHSSGTITPSVSFIITSGSYTQSGTSVLSSVATFTQTAGNVTFRSTYSLTATGTYTLTAGTLTLGGNLTTGLFSSSTTNTRSIAFGAFNSIILAPTAAGTVLNMADLTNFTWTGTGGFDVVLSATKTFTCGTTAGATATSVPNLRFSSGANIPTLTSGSSFNNLDFGASGAAIPNTNINVYGNLTLSSASFSTFTAIMRGAAGTVAGQGSTTLRALEINNSGGTTTLTAALTLAATGITTLTSGNLNLGGFTLTTGTFVSSNANVRSITFGTANIILAHTTAAQVVLSMADATNFTYTSGGTYGSGTGGFRSIMSATRTFTFGTSAGGSITNAPRLILASGASIATITTGGWFAEIDFGTTAYTTAATNLNLISLKSNSSTSVLTLLTATMVGSGSIQTNTTIGPLVINTAGITTTLASSTRCTTVALTQGTLDLAGQSLIGSSTFTWNGGSLLFGIGSLSCTTFTLNGPTLTLTTGTLSPSVSFVLNTGSFTYGGTATFGAIATFTQNSGTVTFNKTYAMNAVSTYAFVLGTLIIADGITLSTGIFSSDNGNTRSIAFGNLSAGNIRLTHTTAATVVLAMSTLTNYSYTGPGGFTVADMGNTRTFTYGNSNGSAATAINLTFTTGAAAAAISNGSWFKTLDFGTTTSTVTGTNINVVGSLFLNGTYTAATINMLGTGSLSGGASASLLGLTINTVGTITMSGNLTMGGTSTTTLTQGSLVLNGFTLTTGRFLSDGTGFTRSIDFGSTNIVLAHATAGTVVLAMGDVTSFTYTGAGGFSSSMGVTRTFTYGSTAGGSTSTAINLLITGGAAVPTITTGGWFNTLNFTGSTCVPAATALNITGNLTLATGGTYTGVSVTILDTSTITPTGRALAAFTVNTANTVTLAGALGCTIYTQTQGTLDFATFNLTCSSTATYTGGTLSNIGTITCTTFTINGPSFTFSSGTITPSVGFTLTSGSFTYNSPAVLSAVATFRQTAGNVTLNQAYSLTATGTYIQTSGALTLGGNLTTGIFNSSSQLFRSIAFSTFNIVLAHTTAAQTVLNMTDIVNYSQTGTGGFTSAMGVTRTFTTGVLMGVPGSISYTGTNQFFLLSSSAELEFGTAVDFTFEAWVNTSSSTTGGALFDITNAALSASVATFFVFGGQAFWSVAGSPFGTTAADSIPSNTWTHVVFQRRGTDFEIYINGTLASSYTPITPINMGSSLPRAYLGRDVAGNRYVGKVTNVRLVKSVAVYTGNFTPSTIPLSAAQSSDTNISALTGFNTLLMCNAARGYYNTDSSIGLVGFSISSPAPTADNSSPFVDSYYGQYPRLSITSGASVPTFTASSLFETLDFTGSTCNPTGTVSINNLTLATAPVYTGLNVTCVGTGSIIQNNKTLGAFEVKNGYVGGTVTIVTNPLAVGSYTQTSGTIDFSSTSLTLSGVYTYIAGTQLNLISIIGGTLVVTGVYNFSSGTLSPSTITVISPGVFTYGGTATLSGVAAFIQTSGSVNINKDFALTATGTYTLTSGTLTLGGNLTTGIFSSTGQLSRAVEFNTYNIVLDHTTAGTTVLSMADSTNFSFTGTGGFTSAMSVTRTFNSGTTAGASGSLLFTGSTQCFLQYGGTVPSTLFAFPADFTVEAWVRPTGLGGSVFNNWNNNGDSGGFTAGTYNNQAYWSTTAGVFGYTAVNSIPANVWTHVAWVRSGSNYNIYINGQLGSTVASIGVTLDSVARRFRIGKDSYLTSALPFGGYISNARLVKGVAVYTGTFTPSSKPLTVIQNASGNVSAIAAGQAVLLLNTPNNGLYLSDTSPNNFTAVQGGSSLVTANALTPITLLLTGDPPNLSIISGASIPTLTNGGSFNNLNFTGSTCTPASTTISLVGDLVLSSGGTFTNLSINTFDTGTITPNGKTIAAFTVNTVGTTTLAGAIGCTTYTQTLGTIDFASFNLTCSSTGLFTSGTLSNIGSITCTTFTVAGAFAHTSGTITPSVSFVTTSGSYTQSGTSVLSSVATFTQTAGNVTFRGTYALTATGTYTLTAGTLTLGGNLTTGIFSSTGTGTRSIDFGTYNVVLAHTTAATTVLNMANITNFTPTGAGGFAADASITRTFTSGTTGGSATNSPNLSLTGSGTAIATFTTGSWFNTLDFGTTTFAIAVTALNLNGLTLSSSGTYTNLTPTARGTGTFTSNGNSLSTLIINAPAATVTTADALTITNAIKLVAGTLVAPYSITSATFLNTGPYSKTITGSTTTYTVTGAGATAWDYASSGSASFNGTSQYLAAPNNATTHLETVSVFTVEAWIYITGIPAGSTQLTIVGTRSGVVVSGWELRVSTSRTLQFYYTGNAGSNTYSPDVLALNTWYHVALVRNSGTAKIFINGTVSVTNNSVTNGTTNSNSLIIGREDGDLTTLFQGYISNLRIVNGVAVYTDTFTVPTAPLLPTQSSDTNISAITGTQTSLLLAPYSDSVITDYSTNEFTITNTGGVTVNTLSPFAVNLPGQITTTNLTISMTSASAKTFAGGNGSYSILNQGGAGALTIVGDNSFADITATTRPSTITFTAGSTQTVANFTLSGILGSLVTINSTSPGTQFNLSRASGTTSVGYLNIEDSNATGGAYWYADVTSFNIGNNTGWIFTAPPAGGYPGNFFAFF